jgi:hypothetical protein
MHLRADVPSRPLPRRKPPAMQIHLDPFQRATPGSGHAASECAFLAVAALDQDRQPLPGMNSDVVGSASAGC